MEKCNVENCTCPHVNCENHGKCCACINAHYRKNSLVYCMRKISEARIKRAVDEALAGK
ncbi:MULTISPECIES: hypothetical protein [Anaerosinus]|uniref:Cytosolic protein n=1 Tax=Selenobaculum gibii TaxID=3054208 RepID=A0A9Y2AIP0_9FIRM|nr:hypothetical protein [Selenobaculum gbiensis]WIW71559.1 hypothetical protein P3F81_04450 [Selenobaculum gbiensis]